MTWDALLIGKALYSTLGGTTGIDTRIYPMRIPQNIDLSTTAAISYYVISTRPETTKDSRSVVDTLRLQISIFSTSYSTINSIAQIVRENFDGLTGEVAGCSIDGVYFDDEVDLFEDEHKVYHRAQDYIIRVKNGASTNANEMVSTLTAVTGDYTWTALVPAGYLLEYMVIEETAGKQAQISAGTTSNGKNVFESEAVTKSALTVININKTFSKTAATTVYLNHAGNGDKWNGASLNIWASVRKYV